MGSVAPKMFRKITQISWVLELIECRIRRWHHWAQLFAEELWGGGAPQGNPNSVNSSNLPLFPPVKCPHGEVILSRSSQLFLSVLPDFGVHWRMAQVSVPATAPPHCGGNFYPSVGHSVFTPCSNYSHIAK